MIKHFLASLTIAAIVLMAPQSTEAQTINLQDALVRMNSIITEMEKLKAEFATLASATGQSSVPTPTVLGAQTSAVFTQSLEPGETNDDIKRIQKLLATDPEIYPYGVASGFFGPKTEEAIKNLQARNGWDTPGIVGPSTKALLEGYFKAYPDENFPADVLKSKPPAPKVLGASTSNTTNTAATDSNNGNPAKTINVELDDDEALIEIVYSNGNRKGLVTDTADRDEIVDFIATRTVLTESQILAVIDYSGKSSRDDEDDEDTDESDAEDALDDAEDAIDDADEAIKEAEDDGDDVDWAEDTLNDAEDLFEEAEEAFDDEDYDEAIDLAEDAEKMAKKAEDRIDEEEDENGEKGDSEDIDEIKVDVDEGESEVTVEYDDGEEYEFTVEEDDEDNIVEEVADELNIDEDEVEDLIKFDYGKIENITVRLDDESLVRIFYTSGVERRLRLNTDDEDEIIEEIADELDLDEDEVEDLVEFD